MEKAYTQIFNGLFWMQQEPVWSAILLFRIAGYLPVLSFRPVILLVEEIVFCMGTMAALLRLFRGPGLSAHAVHFRAASFVAAFVYFYAGLHD
ncbi:hypothetical protein [uncultured Dysosmobacter sp.]|uniref:hypothetical protein n=1 Tax=uncultured Dysosmobacter sp. TaxID=2591384 RepID=UPI00261E5DBF|nr:hypothetical protein [uncultured Dysosmobacter sp.]